MAHQEACQLFIEQEIKEGLAQGKSPGSIGKELAAWVEQVFEAHIPAKTLEKRAQRVEEKLKTNVFNPTTPSNPSQIPENQEFQQVIASTPGPGRKPKYSATEKSVFNRTNDNIEWASWTWNPVTGCKHGCPYCYAWDIAQRFYGTGGFEPKFYPNRLAAPVNTPSPKPP